MNKKHYCECCNYGTDKLSHYKNHLKSKRHIANSKDPVETPHRPPKTHNHNLSTTNLLACQFCGKVLSKACHRSRHEKACYQKKLIEKEREFEEKINNNKLESERMKERNDIYEKMIEDLKEQNERLTTLLAEKATTVNNNTMINNVLNYAEKYYKEAEELKPLEDYAPLMLKNGYTHDEEAIKILIKDGLIKPGEKALILCKEDLYPFVRNLISYKRMNTLHSTIGNFIINNYVKKDKSKQSIHLTDSSRMKFIYTKLQDSIEDNVKENKIEWKNDPKGVNIVTIIIDPMLRYISHQVRIYQKDLANEFVINSADIGIGKINEMEALQSLMNMCLKDNKRNKEYELRKKIMDYVAPHFQFNRELLLCD